ncbi:hypothetical protein H7097_03275 [Aeromicrobium sp.]|nr:hypothetical protein [Candidatus Saccharibacteria bacterium]
MKNGLKKEIVHEAKVPKPAARKQLTVFSNRWVLFLSGLVLATLVILSVRFFTYSINHTHYHANFAVYINGQREDFKAPQYYEEIAACTVNGTIVPAQRAHMHEKVNSVVHVHDDAVTWEQFFNNIGWTLGPNFIQNNERVLYVADDTNKLNIVLNDQNLTDLTSIANEVIKSEDRLLISFGAIDDDTLNNEYETVAKSAHQYNMSNDPASCSGVMDHVRTSDRLKHLF